MIALAIITVFAYVEFPCGLCADAEQREAAHNKYIRMLIVAGWITFAIDMIGYGIMLSNGLFKERAWKKSYDLFQDGLERLEMFDKQRDTGTKIKKQMEMQVTNNVTYRNSYVPPSVVDGITTLGISSQSS